MGDKIEDPKIEDEGSSSYLPEELVTEILCYVPVKSLIRFTCVCKSWLDLIKNNHEFATKHYITRATTSSRVLDNVDCMFNREDKGNKLCMYTFTKAKTLCPLKKFELLQGAGLNHLYASNSCHGIICFQARGEILLCNPSIQEMMLVTPRCRHGGITGFGFDAVNNDYKVVVMGRSRNHLHKYWLVDVYSVRYEQWQSLPNSSALEDIDRFTVGAAASNGNGRMCNWLVYKKILESSGRQVKEVLLSFDMVEQVMRDFQLPGDPRYSYKKLVSSSRWRACLCYIGWSPNTFVDVWVLKDDWMWSKEISVKFPDEEVASIQPSSFWINDKELLVSVERKEVKVKGKGTRTEISQEVFHYNLDSKKLSRTGRKGSLPEVYSRGYVESLISIKKFMLSSSYKHDEFDKVTEQEFIEDCETEYVFRELRRKGVWSCTFKLGC